MKIRIPIALLAVACLTSCTTPLLTQEKVNQIKPGVTTMDDLVRVFGPPQTKLVSYQRDVYADWIRDEPMPPVGYLPLNIGSFFGGLDLNVEQLSVHLASNGRLQRYSIYDSLGEVKSEHALHGLSAATSLK